MRSNVLFSIRMKEAQIISIGNELLIGDTINTNASWIGGFLTELGFKVCSVITIPDHYEMIKKNVDDSLNRFDLTIVTGGLGPTHDDITKKVMADLFESDMVLDEKVLRHVENIFEKRGFLMSDVNKMQAEVPDCSTVLFNKQGTAPGMWFHRKGKYLAVLPGVPHEMKYLMGKGVKLEIEDVFPGREIWLTEYFKTAGIPESTLSDLVGNLDEFINNGVGIAYLPNPEGVTIRISSSGKDGSEADKKLIKLRKLLNEKASDFIYAKGKETALSSVVGDILSDQKLTIATAESCTGGLLANRITNIAGCSRYMNGGVVTYSNESKADLLRVNQQDLDDYGAVSKQVAMQMAKNVAEKFSADIGVSTTGIAGPGGGTQEKPVGTVWMGFWIQGKHYALHTIFTDDRLINKKRTVMVVLETLRRELLNIESKPYNLKPEDL